MLSNQPSLIEYNGLSFLIHDLPTNSNLKTYLSLFQKNNVSHLVRVCSSEYDKKLFEKNEITVVDLPYDDGSAPPKNIIDQWLKLIDKVFPRDSKAETTMAIHCVAGLGRAPVMVAIALLERDKNLSPEDAITLIRKKRKGAINLKQVKFLQNYKRKSSSSCKTQ
eukprot:gene8479-301_t